MGKWNNRWIPNPRSYRNDNRGRFQRQLPPTYPQESSENSVPEWEKIFCYKVGSVPWRKVLDTKSFASCYPDVMDWDDSEAKDIFDTAKRRFWASMNGQPTDDVPLPDPDAYIDMIDWNTSIDSEVFMDLESALRGADADAYGDTEAGGTGVVDISALTQNSKWHGTADEVWNSGGCWDKSNDGGWGKADNWGVGPVTEDPNVAKNGDTPWECRPDKTNGLAKTIAWGDCTSKSWVWKQPEQSYMKKNLHDVANAQVCGSAKGNVWAASGNNNSWGRKSAQNKFHETNDWDYGSAQYNGGSAANKWVRHTNQNNLTDSYHKGNGNWESGNRGGEHKRESPNNYTPRSKSPRFQRTDNRKHEAWRNGQKMQRTGSSFITS